MRSVEPGRLKAAVIGCGRFAIREHIPALRSIGEVELYAFGSRSGEKAKAARDASGNPAARIYTDTAELLADREIDLVVVCTPNATHAAIAIAALEHGKHTLCEKPMAVSSADCRRMVETAERSGRKLSIGFQNRFRPEVQFLHGLCRGGRLGEIYHAKAHAVRRRGVPTWGAFLSKEIQGGGPLIDIGSHSIDLALWLMDNYEPAWVIGKTYRKLAELGDGQNRWGEWRVEDFTVEDSAFGFVLMANGATLAVDAAWALNTSEEREASVTLFGTRAGADMKNGLILTGAWEGAASSARPEFPAAAGPEPSGDAARATPAYLQARAFVDAILGDRDPPVSPRQALVVAQIVESLYESDRARRPVRLAAGTG
jgi:predicted dehydrogenase